MLGRIGFTERLVRSLSPKASPAPLETKSLAAPSATLLELFNAAPSVSGIAVTPTKAMTCPPVRAAVQAIAETIGQLPIHVYARAGDGSRERAPEHVAHALLHDAANDWTPATKLREEVTRDALIDKGGFAEIIRIDGRPFELHRLEPSNVETGSHEITREPTYKLTEGKTARFISWRDIIHIPSPSLSGSTLIRDAREAIARALILEQYAIALFTNGAKPSGLLINKGKLSDQHKKNLKDAFDGAFSGKKTGGTAILEGDLAYQRLTLSSVDAQYLELCKFSIEEIARVFRVPPIFVGEYGRATWANSEEQGNQLLTYTLMPWIKRWEGELQLKLFADDKTHFAEFLTDDLARADIAKRYEAYAKAIAARFMNPNEARSRENWPAYPGGEIFQNPNTSYANTNASVPDAS